MISYYWKQWPIGCSVIEQTKAQQTVLFGLFNSAMNLSSLVRFIWLVCSVWFLWISTKVLNRTLRRWNCFYHSMSLDLFSKWRKLANDTIQFCTTHKTIVIINKFNIFNIYVFLNFGMSHISFKLFLGNSALGLNACN